MYKHTKAIINACEKAAVNISRDLIEINHLHGSKNLSKFVKSSQARFESNIAKELSSETSEIVLFSPDGTSKSINNSYRVAGNNSNFHASVIGIDNMINLGHGIENIAFGLSLEATDWHKITAVYLPATNTAIYSENSEEFFSLSQDGLTRKIKVNQSVNINFPTIVCATDHHNHQLNIKREIHFVSSGSILCDLVRVLQNKIDIAFYTRPSEEFLKFISYFVNGSGGADGFINGSYVFGKKLLVRSSMQKSAEGASQE